MILEEIQNISPEATEEELDSQTSVTTDDTETVYTFAITVTMPDEESADSLVSVIESESFESELEEVIESETHSVIANNGINSEAAAMANDDTPVDDDDEVDWLDW